MRHHHTPSFTFHRRHWNVEVTEYYVYQTLYQVAYSTLSLYLPIYLLELGYSLREVVLWFVINELWFVLLSPLAGRVVQWLGMKKAIALKLPALALFFLLIQRLTGSFAADLPFAVAILGIRAIAKTPADLAEDLFLTKYVLKRSEGKMLALLKILMVGADILSPLVGGLVAYVWGMDAMFSAGCVLILVSAVPLFLTHDRHFRCDYGSVDVASFPLQKLDRSYLIAEAASGLPDTLMWIVWPLFMYFVVRNTADIGLLVSLSGFASILVSYWIGKRIDHRDPRALLRIGARAQTGLFFLRGVALHPVAISIIDACSSIAAPLRDIPYGYFMYRYVKRQPNQLEMVNVKQFVGEAICFAGTLLIFGITLFAPEPSAKLYIGLFIVFSLFLPFMARMARLEPANTRPAADRDE